MFHGKSNDKEIYRSVESGESQVVKTNKAKVEEEELK
jgi:hypothetical protein